jgi:hypothetical protein
MNRDLSDLPGAGDQRDPVEEFFAAQRADVDDLAPGPDRWEGIVTEARRPVRRRWLPYAGAAAAAVVVGAVAWGGLMDRQGGDADRDPAVASSSGRTGTQVTSVGPRPTTTQSAPTAPVSSPPPTTAGPTTTPTTRTGPLPAPATFGLVSLTTGADGKLRALGSATCQPGNKPCVSVVGSEDNGAGWTARATLTGTATGLPRATPSAPEQFAGLRFATADIGYAYGGTTMRTADGGRNFTPFDVGGRTVLSLEAGGGKVWMVTAQKCAQGTDVGQRGCTGLEVWSADTSATRATKVSTLPTPGPVETAWLSMDGSDAYVSTNPTDDQAVSTARRVSGAATELPRPAGCAPTGALWTWATADAPGALVAVCRADGRADAAYALATSTDKGATWSKATPAPDLGTPGAGGVWVTATDLRHLVAVVGALPSTDPDPTWATQLRSSSDGGRTWAQPKGTGNSGDWAWAGAGGGKLVYAVPADSGAYYVSNDSGASFRSVAFRR